ncbi:ABC transporter permease [Lysobacteraceae bacterium NML120232]|nr:ABC transporter permease [Xanthomonadaceae bacterium NML120232]
MPALHRKALRDLWLMRGQAIAIALVVAAGIAMLVMSQATLDSLRTTRDAMYRDYAFADVWANLKRAPESMAQRVAELPGVASVETQVQASAKLVLVDYSEPVEALMLSLPDEGSQPLHNRLYLRAGRMPAPFAADEVLLSDAFAEVHGLKPGDRLRATVYGRSQWFTLVGIAVSPEYLLQSKPAAMFPDYERYAIVWAPRRALEAALNMDGAFNQLSVRMSPDARSPTDEAELIAAIDRLLMRWGGLGAVGRMNQYSYRYLHEEFRQLATMTRIFPTIFLGVAAFLLNVVFARLIGTQRAQIAILKAFGYRTRDMVLHYGLMATLICLCGAVIGIAAGIGLGQMLSGLYQENFRFPYLAFALDWRIAALGVMVALTAAVAGAGRAVLQAAGEPVAQAMRPVAPERYRATVVERLGLTRWLSQPARMVLRQIERRPWRAVLSITGLALAGAIIMMARFQGQTITYMIDMQFRLAEHHDVSVQFIEAAPARALYELRALPGVQQVEGLRTVAVKLSHEQISFNTAIEGLPPDGRLRRLIDTEKRRLPLPEVGLVLSDYLAQKLGVGVGDIVQVQVLQGRRAQLQLPVAALVSEYVGTRAYMATPALNRALGEGELYSGALLTVLPEEVPRLMRTLDARPGVVAAESRLASIRAFFDMLDRISGPFTLVSLLMGAIVNFGVVYNAARITLAERARELASLRVLGFGKGEVARILLGEIGLLVLLSIPLSFAAGWGLTWLLVRGLQSELYRIPIYIPPSSYAFVTLVTLGSSIVSALAVLRQIYRLDMSEALKTHG